MLVALLFEATKPASFNFLQQQGRFDEFTQLTHMIAHRIGRHLERRGLLERDTGNSYLTAQAVETPDDDPSHHLLGHSITYRIAMGPQQGRKVFA